ncbi:PE-PPE domain-containing protein [Mycobacterium sp. pUA109]|uniref:PE-PPE domain-containing protein n=1 Tax=Mycobacterium sp. pUA109 TaxID=3238982 RepID=UPI00351BBCF5
MAATRLRSLGAVLSAAVGAAVVGATSALTSVVIANIALLADEAWIMGGTAVPDPTVDDYMSQVEALYLQPNGFTGPFTPLDTPEQFCPIVCLTNPAGNPAWDNLNFGNSVNVGAQQLNTVLGGNGDAGVIFGYSQSATIATQELNNLIKDGVDASNLHYVLIGDPNNPLGGILDRFQFPDGIKAFSLTPVGQHLPFLNVPLSMDPTPTAGIGASDIYTGEYDGWANFPQDPTNLLADINAIIGIETVHPYYPDLTADQVASAINVGTIGDTDFYYLPQNLPILQFMFNGGTAGQFFGDFFSPWARLFIDWGYGNAGDPAVDGLYTIPGGTYIEGSAYEQAIGVAGGPWAETPLGTLYDGSGVAGLFEKMDPLQMLAGLQNAFIQSVIGPWADVAANGGTLSAGELGIINDITVLLQNITGYDLVNLVDGALLTGWNDLANLLDLGSIIGPDAILDGPLIAGQPLIDLVGLGFDIFNFFGA